MRKLPFLCLLLLGSVISCPTWAAEDNRLVLWNQHNGVAKDRGTKACKIEVFNGASTLWKLDRLEIPWDASADAKAELTIPKLKLPIERIRITILETLGNGGGL